MKPTSTENVGTANKSAAVSGGGSLTVAARVLSSRQSIIKDAPAKKFVKRLKRLHAAGIRCPEIARVIDAAPTAVYRYVLGIGLPKPESVEGYTKLLNQWLARLGRI